MNIEDKKERALLNLISEASKDRLLKAGNVISLDKGELLFSERDEVKDMYIVLEGYMTLYRNSRFGEIKIIFICAYGEILNEMVLQDNKTSICGKALTDTKLLAINKGDLGKLMSEDDKLTIEIFNSLARKTRRLYHQIGNTNGTYPLEKRLAVKIWKLARDYGKNSEEGVDIPFETTVTFLANMRGAKRETISRIISQLKKDGIIIHRNGFLTVPDMAKLREITQ